MELLDTLEGEKTYKEKERLFQYDTTPEEPTPLEMVYFDEINEEDDVGKPISTLAWLPREMIILVDQLLVESRRNSLSYTDHNIILSPLREETPTIDHHLFVLPSRRRR